MSERKAGQESKRKSRMRKIKGREERKEERKRLNWKEIEFYA